MRQACTARRNGYATVKAHKARWANANPAKMAVACVNYEAKQRVGA